MNGVHKLITYISQNRKAIKSYIIHPLFDLLSVVSLERAAITSNTWHSKILLKTQQTPARDYRKLKPLWNPITQTSM